SNKGRRSISWIRFSQSDKYSFPIEWKICEFFIIAKFQGKGIGQQVAKEIFYRFPGRWIVTALSENSPAIKFWQKIINEVSSGQFTEVLKTAEELATPEK